MGDRTFSAEDVIRIYEDYLTENERGTVDLFFAPEVDINVAVLRRLLDLLLGLLQALTTPFVGLVLSLLSQATTDAFREATAEIARTNRALDNEIRRIDA